MNESPSTSRQSSRTDGQRHPNRARRRSWRHRDKIFGRGRPSFLTGQERRRLLAEASKLQREAYSRQDQGSFSRCCHGVLYVLLFKFGHSKTGQCFPALAAIAAAAGCCINTVQTCLKHMEAAGLLSWVNTLRRGTVEGVDMFGERYRRQVPLRGPNAYGFRKLACSPDGIRCQGQKTTSLSSNLQQPKKAPEPVNEDLKGGLDRLLAGIKRKLSG